MNDYRKVWMEGSGESIPKGWHVHHLIPRSEGGPDEYWNLICVSPEMHYDIHFVRGDMGACALISDGIDREAPSKPVIQFDLDGYRIKRFESLNAVVDEMGVNPGGVNWCCEYKKKSLKGMQYFWESEVGDSYNVGPVEKKQDSGGGDTTPQGGWFSPDGNGPFKSANEAWRDYSGGKNNWPSGKRSDALLNIGYLKR